MLEKEFKYYLEHQKELVPKYNGKFLVIINEKIDGAYDNKMQAYEETIKNHQLGTFLIQECTPGDESYTQTFHSRVIITPRAHN